MKLNKRENVIENERERLEKGECKKKLPAILN